MQGLRGTGQAWDDVDSPTCQEVQLFSGSCCNARLRYRPRWPRHLAWMLWLWSAAVWATSVQLVPPTPERVDLLNSSEFLLDATATMTLDEARAATTWRTGRPPAYTADAVWLRYRLKNPGSTPLERWFDTGNRTLQQLDFYMVLPDGTVAHQDASVTRPFVERPIPLANFVFPITVPADSTMEVLLRVRSLSFNPVLLKPQLAQPEVVQRHARFDDLQWTMTLAVLFSVGVVNLALGLYLRDTGFLLYVASLLSMALAACSFAGGMGSAYELFWPESPRWEQIAADVLVPVSAISQAWFVLHLLQARTHFPRLARVVWACVALTTLIVAVTVAGTWLQRDDLGGLLQAAYITGSVTWLPIYPTLLLAIVWGAIQRQRIAWYLLVAYLPYVTMLIISSGGASARGEPPHWSNALVAAAFWEVFILALALADRFLQERRAKMAAQAKTITNLQESERLLEAKVAARTHELAQEKQQTERLLERNQDLLHNILPPSVAAELAQHGCAAPIELKSATILFTDFSGFTQAASAMPAERMVAELNAIFSAFDDICRNHGIEKIKTIGDAYMAAAGVPVPCADHALRAVRVGLAMSGYIAQRNATSAFKWALRVGVHSGPVVAGVVGKHKYAFDVWGDTVNIASRMESTGEVGRVNVSAYTYDLIRADVDCVYRGKIGAKGKGEIDMYFVRSELAGDNKPHATDDPGAAQTQ